MTECIQRCGDNNRPKRFSKCLDYSNASKLVSYCSWISFLSFF